MAESDLRALLTMRDVIDVVDRAFRSLAGGEVVSPERLRLDLPERQGVMLEMPAYLGSSEGVNQTALGTKIVSVFEGNAQRGIDLVQAVYLLLDADSGVPLALMEGRFITAIRTAATSAVATRHMAPAGKKRLAIFGAGVQARFHVEAMLEVTEVERVMIASRTEEIAVALAESVVSVHKIACEVLPAEQAAVNADLICTCTSSSEPLFPGRLVNPGTHINAVGAFTPSTRELDTETVRRARVIVDAVSAAGREAGEILIPLSEGSIDATHVKGSLADVVSGEVRGRESASEITLFKSCGLAIEDLATARLAYARATERGMGIRVEL